MRVLEPGQHKLNEMAREIRTHDRESGHFPVVRAGFLGNFTLDLLLTAFRYACYSDGLRPDLRAFSGEDVLQAIMQEENNLLDETLDLVCLCLRREPLGLSPFYDPGKEAGEEGGEARALQFLKSCLLGVRQRTRAPILIHNFDVPVHSAAGIRDLRSRDGCINRVRQLNLSLVDLAAGLDGVHLIDIDLLQSRLGNSGLHDRRFWHLGRSPYTPVAAQLIASETMRAVRSLTGRARKCLVLDCDNTLWGGVVGEVGSQGIQLGGEYPGAAYQEFQRAVLALHDIGVVLALCSKNNEADVLEILERHPEMVLRSEHFVAMRINWQDKAANLMEISREINLGLDSFVFADDSRFEVGLVDRLLPQVATLLLPDDPARYVDALLTPGVFDSLEFSGEDKSRNAMYRAEAQRKLAMRQNAHATVEDFYRDLHMKVRIDDADDMSSPRIAQLTQRSNQFNLTTVRYSETMIRELVESDVAVVRGLRLSDSFGDLGLVGVSVLRCNGPDCVIEAFLLSCRALGRGVERVLLKDCEIMARKLGLNRLAGSYIPSSRNMQVKDFFDRNGFVLLGTDPDGTQRYLRELTRPLKCPEHFTVASDIWDGREASLEEAFSRGRS